MHDTVNGEALEGWTPAPDSTLRRHELAECANHGRHSSGATPSSMVDPLYRIIYHALACILPRHQPIWFSVLVSRLAQEEAL